MHKIKTILILTIVVFLAIISMANLHNVTFKLLVTEINMPLILLIFLILATGFITGYITKGIIDFRKDKKQLSQSEKGDKI